MFLQLKLAKAKSDEAGFFLGLAQFEDRFTVGGGCVFTVLLIGFSFETQKQFDSRRRIGGNGQLGALVGSAEKEFGSVIVIDAGQILAHNERKEGVGEIQDCLSAAIIRDKRDGLAGAGVPSLEVGSE